MEERKQETKGAVGVLGMGHRHSSGDALGRLKWPFCCAGHLGLEPHPLCFRDRDTSSCVPTENKAEVNELEFPEKEGDGTSVGL